MAKVDIGIIGLGVMGPNLALNMADKGFTVLGYDHATSNVDEFLAGKANGKTICGVYSLSEMVEFVSRPRKILLMVPPGDPVDEVLKSLIPMLEPGDTIIDGGNSHYKDTTRRVKELAAHGIHMIGTGISGGSEGALKGPSIMPGGSEAAWPEVRPILDKIAAKLPDGTPCCRWMGPDGAGHFVKMVHNGIEYGDMQLISEAYFALREALGMNADELHDVFSEWNSGELSSYLVQITADIFTKKDPETGQPLVDVILDSAGQKGTGSWASETALEMGIDASTIAAAVFARCISAIKPERVAASRILPGPEVRFSGDTKRFIDDIRNALYASKICSYAQGFALLREASKEYDWKLNYADIALTWREGCIIRAGFLEPIQQAFESDPNLPNLLTAPYFRERIVEAAPGWRRVLCATTALGIPIPGFSSSLAYFDSYRHDRLPANLIQAQRDYFGAHTYKRLDKEGSFHTEWLDVQDG